MKKIIVFILSILVIIFPVSCVGIRTNFKFPNEYGPSDWETLEENVHIFIKVDENSDSYGFITYQEITRKYKILFAIDGASFRCLNENDEYILEDGTFMQQEQYEYDFPNVQSNVKGSSFVVTKTQNKTMECYITYKELNYIFSDFEYESDEMKKIYFVFKMIEK